MGKPKGLGRGLDALLGHGLTPPSPGFSSSSAPVSKAHPDDVQAFPNATGDRGSAVHISISDIERNPDQPRSHFDESKLRELADSIKAHGIIQPLTLRKIRASKYQIIAGERRFRAAQLAGLTHVPAYVRTADDHALLEMALVENIQREDLDPLEIAMSYQRLIEECGLTHESLASRMGQGRSTITNHLRLLTMHETVQTMLRNRSLSMGHAKVLAGMTGPDALVMQGALAEKVVAEGASILTLKQWLEQGWPQAKHKPTARREWGDVSEDEEQALQRLRLRLNGTKAKLSLKRTKLGGGHITLSYQDVTDLEAILQKLGLD
ncbi:MAG: ParB/RepB/Spo0J family partition protein [Bacteroidetes bacterium]|nr:ParB/RepB/Spo0J family partition protein [Bacteroidota bacterium]MDA0903071.1 ParB/RepB/Spo0J family partition protein [Bacteroidota bacterium]MDA1241719.1 ParB/RepB/Spo0J family partition protein [Bacteroidota bacterium]